MRGTKLKNYISEYFTDVKYNTTYALKVGSLSDKIQYIKIDIGYRVLPPILNLRSPKISKKKRIRSIYKNTSKKMLRCKCCGELGHHAKNCKNLVEESQALVSLSSALKKSRR